MLRHLASLIERTRGLSPEDRDATVLFIDIATEYHILDEVTVADVGGEMMGRIFFDGLRGIPSLYGFPVLWGAAKTEARQLTDLNEDEQHALSKSFRRGRHGSAVIEKLERMMHERETAMQGEARVDGHA